MDSRVLAHHRTPPDYTSLTRYQKRKSSKGTEDPNSGRGPQNECEDHDHGRVSSRATVDTLDGWPTDVKCSWRCGTY